VLTRRDQRQGDAGRAPLPSFVGFWLAEKSVVCQDRKEHRHAGRTKHTEGEWPRKRPNSLRSGTDITVAVVPAASGSTTPPRATSVPSRAASIIAVRQFSCELRRARGGAPGPRRPAGNLSAERPRSARRGSTRKTCHPREAALAQQDDIVSTRSYLRIAGKTTMPYVLRRRRAPRGCARQRRRSPRAV